MKLNIISDNYDISVSAYELSYFSRTKRSAAQIMNFEPYDCPPSMMRWSNVELSANVSGQLDFSVFGRADGAYFERDLWVIEKYRVVGKLTSRTTPFSDARFLCECVLCAYMLMMEKGCRDIALRMVITDEKGEKTKGFECVIGADFAARMWNTVISRALRLCNLRIFRRTKRKLRG